MQRRATKTKTRMMLRIGVLVFLFTPLMYSEKGKAPSQAIAKLILEVTVRELNPAKKRFIISMQVIARAPALLFRNAF